MTDKFFQIKEGSIRNGSRVRVIANSRICNYGDSPIGTQGTIKSYQGKRKAYMPDTDTFKMIDSYMVQWDGSDFRSATFCDEFEVL